MPDYTPYIEWLDSQAYGMKDLVVRWAEINSGSYNLAGLGQLLSDLEREFKALAGDSERLELAPQEIVDGRENPARVALGRALRIRMRPNAPIRVFLGCHMDTVYGADHPFQKTLLVDDNTLRGPGVTDAKGGLVVMLRALEAFERSPWAYKLGWEVLINPDEEIGSPGSSHLLSQAARRNQVGLVFEPAFFDGSLASERTGSGNFTAITRGKAAHAGRDPHLGRSAISALAWFIVHLNAFASGQSGITVNVGYLEGGGAVNVVPDRALCKFNVRVKSAKDQELVEEHLERVTDWIKLIDGISLELYGQFGRPPKPLDEATLKLLGQIAECGKSLDLAIDWRPSGGSCDGNILSAAGLPTVDTLGVRGGDLHSAKEYLLLDSLVERARLTALYLMKVGSGEIDIQLK